MPMPPTTAPPTAVPKAMPVLNAVGSSELARVSALGCQRRAAFIKTEMHGTETMYIESPTARMLAMAVAGEGPASQTSASSAAWMGKLTMSALRPKRPSATRRATQRSTVHRP